MTKNNTELQLSEVPAIELFKKLGYQYCRATDLGDERESLSDVVLKERFKASIKRLNPWINDHSLTLAFREITHMQGSSLMEINENIHKYLIGKNYSVTQIIEGKSKPRGVMYIDYDQVDNNDFLVVSQMKFIGKHMNSIPDLVVFVNGLPLAVIECKSPRLENSASDSITDLQYYQENTEKLFFYNQVCAGVYKVGGKYGAIEAEEKHYHLYKSEDNNELEKLLDNPCTNQDILIFHLFKKENFLDLIQNFIIFEDTEIKTIKKLPRYNQIRATNKAISKLRGHQKGGVIWHTQGSGKSLTMIYLATKLRRDNMGFKNPTIIVMTDRKDLDDQITRTFNRCKFPNPHPARSIRDLKNLLQNPYGKTIFTTLQKFQETDENGQILKNDNPTDANGNSNSTKRRVNKDGKLEKVYTLISPEGKKIQKDTEEVQVMTLSEKENIFVFVDEAHRSHYGFTAAFMRKALPKAKFIAFTGTPIQKEDKSTLKEFYGGDYIDKYTIKESVDDGATLPIMYDAGLPKLFVDKELLEKQFQSYFKQESEARKEFLINSATQLSRIMSTEERINDIAKDILDHYINKIYLKGKGYKAMVVCQTREAAVNYKAALDDYIAFKNYDFSTRIVMTLDQKKDPEKYKQLSTPEGEIKQTIKNFKLPFGEKDTPSEHSKNNKHYNNDAFLIVCDMLLTGYDVPIVQVMYLDKLLKEHNLLQAIARVNRTMGEKEAGYILDYCGITEHLAKALEMFSGDLSPNDVMVKTGEEIPRLEANHQKLVSFFKSICVHRKKQRDLYIENAVIFLEPVDLRDQFRTLLSQFHRSLKIVLPDPEGLKYFDDIRLYNDIRYEMGNTYPDDFKRITREESKKIQDILDKNLKASGVKPLLKEPISIIDRKKFKEEINNSLSGKLKELKMVNRTKHWIKVHIDHNPGFYKPLSERLEELIELRKKDRITQLELFQEIEQIQNTISRKEQKIKELGFKNEGEFAVYKLLEKKLKKESKEVTLEIFQSLAEFFVLDEWKRKEQVQRHMRVKIKDFLYEKVPVEEKESITKAILETIKKNL
jgi:type I restriction enzyme R subunit